MERIDSAKPGKSCDMMEVKQEFKEEPQDFYEFEDLDQIVKDELGEIDENATESNRDSAKPNESCDTMKVKREVKEEPREYYEVEDLDKVVEDELGERNENAAKSNRNDSGPSSTSREK